MIVLVATVSAASRGIFNCGFRIVDCGLRKAFRVAIALPFGSGNLFEPDGKLVQRALPTVAHRRLSIPAVRIPMCKME
jgi:hypothetical protein